MADPNVMLVEGADEWNLFLDLLRNSPLDAELEVNRDKQRRTVLPSVTPKQPLLFKEKDGIERLLGSLSQELRASDLKRLGIVVDADDDIKGRWTQLRRILVNFGYDTTPEIPDKNGTIVGATGKPRVGIWIMPNNVLGGILEDFIGLLIPPSDVLWPQAAKSVDEVIVLDRRFAKPHRSKALIHTWLAWQKAPGTSLGQAVTKHCLDPNAPQAQRLLDWISRLFENEL